jgi:hypothetical protein
MEGFFDNADWSARDNTRVLGAFKVEGRRKQDRGSYLTRAIDNYRLYGMISSRIISRTMNRQKRKAKKSYTLSPEIVEFLEAVRKKRHAESVSAILEEILQNARREHERASVERTVADYYSSLTDLEVDEHARWGEFALAQVANENKG